MRKQIIVVLVALLGNAWSWGAFARSHEIEYSTLELLGFFLPGVLALAALIVGHRAQLRRGPVLAVASWLLTISVASYHLVWLLAPWAGRGG